MADDPTPGGDGLVIKVMSFNIRYGTADDGKQSWPHRRELVLERIRSFDPHLLGLQECRDDTQASYLRARLQGYEFLGVQRGGDGESAIEMAPLLFKRSAFQVVDSGHFWLSDTPTVPGSSSRESIFPRTVTWVTLMSKHSDPTPAQAWLLTFFNTHLDYGGKAAAESARLLRRRIDQLPATMPVILTGDFNTQKDTAPYHTLLQGMSADSSPLFDTYRAVHPERGASDGTYHDFGQAMTAQAIDWILASDHFVVVEASVDRTRRGSLYPSDHYPLLATTKLPSLPSRSGEARR